MWFWTILSVAIASSVSLIGILVLFLGKNRLQKILILLVAFAVGAILGDAFLHIIPETYTKNPESNIPALFILGGILIFFMLEKILRWRHCHHLPDDCEHTHPVATMNLIGDGVHNFLDGALIAGSYLVSFELGLATTLAVLLHEIPQEIGDYATLVHAGYSTLRALVWNFIIACTAFIGAIVVLWLNPDLTILQTYLLPLTAGGFIYIGASDLIPMLHKKNSAQDGVLQFVCIVIGIAMMFSLTFLE